MVFKALPVGVSRNVDGSVLPLVSGDGTVVGFSSSQGDTFMPALATDPLTGGVALVGPGGTRFGATYNFTSSGNLTETLLIGSDTLIAFNPEVTITGLNSFQHTLIRTGNAEFSAAQSPIPGVSIYCADGQTAGSGSMRYTSGTTSLAWQAPGDSAYGVEVDISGVTNAATVAVFKLASSTAGKAVYVYVAPASRTTLTRTIQVAEVTGAKPVTWVRTSNVTVVVETAHKRRIGDFVILFSATSVQRHGYISAVSTNGWSIADTGANTSGSATAYGVRNVQIAGNGATLDYNKAGQATGLMSNLHAIILNACSDVTIENLQVNNATKYACLVTGYKNFAARGFSSYRSTSTDLTGNSDVVHPLGPGRGFVAENTRAQGGDNIIGVGSSDYYDYVFNCPSYGDLSLIDGQVTSSWCEDTDEHPIRFYVASGNNVIKNWVIDGVFGTYSAGADACVAIIMDTMSGGMVDQGSTNIDGLTIISPDAVRSDGSASFAFVNRGAGTRKNIKLQRVRPRASTTSMRATCWVEGGSSISDLAVEFYAGDFSGYLVGLTGTASVGRLTVSSSGVLNGNNELGATFRPVVVALDSSTSVLSYLDIQGTVLDDSSTSGTKICGVLNNGTIGDVSISGVRMLDGDALYRNTSTAVAAQVIRATDVNAVADHVIYYDGGAPSAVFLINVWHNRVANALFAVNAATAQDMRVRLVNCRAGNRMLRNLQGGHTWRISGYGNEPGGGGAIVTDAGAPSWRFEGDWDLASDGALIDATVANHRAGAKFYNTNAAYGLGVGAYVRGSATWTRVAA